MVTAVRSKQSKYLTWEHTMASLTATLGMQTATAIREILFPAFVILHAVGAS